jgi:predicted DNA-binding transcriptional regulator YafY
VKNENLTRQQRRIKTIDRILRDSRQPTVQTFLDALEQAGYPATRRTFMRDLERMRSDMGAPIECNPSTYCYSYSKPWLLGDFFVEKDDLQAIALARELLEHYQGIPVADELKATYDRLLGYADDNVRKELIGGDLAPIAFSQSPQPPIKPDVWKTCLTAIRRRQTIKINYRKGWSLNTGNSQRKIDPYRIVNLNGTWYLIATAGLTDNSLRQYNMARIMSAEPLKVHFKVPDTLFQDIDDMIGNAFGSFLGSAKDVVEIAVEFSPQVATLVREMRFHTHEKQENLADGRTRISFPVSKAGPWPFYHIISWILSWGRDATVVSPPELVNLVENEIRLMAVTWGERPDR